MHETPNIYKERKTLETLIPGKLYSLELPEHGQEGASVVRIHHVEYFNNDKRLVWFSGPDHNLDFFVEEKNNPREIKPTRAPETQNMKRYDEISADSEKIAKWIIGRGSEIEIIIPQQIRRKGGKKEEVKDFDGGRFSALVNQIRKIRGQELLPEKTPKVSLDRPTLHLSIDTLPDEESEKHEYLEQRTGKANYNGTKETALLEKLFQSGFMQESFNPDNPADRPLIELQRRLPELARASILMSRLIERREALVDENFEADVTSTDFTEKGAMEKLQNRLNPTVHSLAYNAQNMPKTWYELAGNPVARNSIGLPNFTINNTLENQVVSPDFKKLLTSNISPEAKKEIVHNSHPEVVKNRTHDTSTALFCFLNQQEILNNEPALKQTVKKEPLLYKENHPIVLKTDHPFFKSPQIVTMYQEHGDFSIGEQTYGTHFNPQASSSLVGTKNFPIKERITFYNHTKEKESESKEHFNYRVEVLTPEGTTNTEKIASFLHEHPGLKDFIRKSQTEGRFFVSGSHYLTLKLLQQEYKKDAKEDFFANLDPEDPMTKIFESFSMANILQLLGMIDGGKTYNEDYLETYKKYIEPGLFQG